MDNLFRDQYPIGRPLSSRFFPVPALCMGTHYLNPLVPALMRSVGTREGNRLIVGGGVPFVKSHR